MKKSILVVVGVVLALAVLLFGLSRSGLGQKGSKERTAQAAPSAQPSSGGEGSMPGMPGMSQPQSGKAKESAKEEKTPEETPTIEIDTDKQQLIGAKTTVVEARSLERIIRTVGKIEYDEKRLATINTKFEGWIERLYADSTGKYVKKGEALAEVYSPELMATQQEFLNVLRWSRQSAAGSGQSAVGTMLSKDAETMVEAAKQRLRLWDISDEEIRKIEESGKPIRTVTLYSPVNGYVIQKMALKGMRVMPGEKLFDIADLSTVWIIADIYESELPMIKVGDNAKLTLSYFPGREFSSRIDYVYPMLSGDTRTAKARFSIPNPQMQLKPQMFTNVVVRVGLGKRLAVPDDAVIDTGTRQVVYVYKGEGVFEPREVLLGTRAEGFREVLSGLKAGDKVASAATFLIDSEAQLKGVKPLPGHKH